MSAGSQVLRSVLLVGQSPVAVASVRDHLQRLAGQVRAVDDGESAFRVLAESSPDVVIVCQGVPPRERVGLLRRTQGLSPRPPVVFVTDTPDAEEAVRLIREGAYDYVGGPLDADRLGRLVEGIRLERSAAADGRDRYFCSECPSGVEVVGQAEGIVKTLEMIRLVSESRCDPILILGETGVGKELAAKAVHAWRSGSLENLVAINCAALTANLLESELFGHVKGAFTGADRDKTGLLEVAGTGTVLLDEISEMPKDLQAKLLRVVQDRTFRKVGGTGDVECAATLVATSNRDLLHETQAGRFRKDLYYRLAVFPIKIPPLRSPHRRDDIPLLAKYFVQTSRISAGRRIAGLSKTAEEVLLRHDWPGNVRELRNVIDRAMILEPSRQIGPASLIIEHADSAGAQGGARDAAQTDFSLEAAEREFILRALKETGWQRTRAAALLGITRATLHAKLKRYDIKAPGGRASGHQGPDESDGDAAADPDASASGPRRAKS